MRWVDRLERRWGRYAIPNLMNLLVIGQALLWFLTMFITTLPLQLFPLDRAALLHGQVWRLITFVFMPSLGDLLGGSLLSFALFLYMYWWIGNVLAHAWGDFRFQVFIAAGMVGAWLSCLLTGYSDTSGIFMSLFFAYAWMWPEQRLLFMFIVPVKAKWLGWASAAVWALNFLRGGLAAKCTLLFGLAGFLLFFGRELWDWARGAVTSYRRRRDWQNKWK